MINPANFSSFFFFFFSKFVSSLVSIRGESKRVRESFLPYNSFTCGNSPVEFYGLLICVMQRLHIDTGVSINRGVQNSSVHGQ